MKISYEGENGVKFLAENPSESLKQYWRNRLKDVIEEEIQNFVEEVAVAMRTMQPGTKRKLKSRPIIVTLESIKEEALEAK